MDERLLPQNRHVDGKRAWMVAVTSSFLMALTVGSISAYGEMYAELVSYSPSDSKTVIGLQTAAFGFQNLIGSLAVILNKRFGSRATMFMAGIVTTVGYITSAVVATTIPSLLYVTYSLLIGCGAGIVFITSQMVITQYFRKYLAFALAILMAGTSTGMFVWPCVFRLLFEMYSIRGALIVIGAICLHVCCISLVMKPIPECEESNRVKVENYGSDEISHDKMFFQISQTNDVSCTLECERIILKKQPMDLPTEKDRSIGEGRKKNCQYKIYLMKRRLVLVARTVKCFLSEKARRMWRFIKTPNFPPYLISRILVMSALNPVLVLISAFALEIGLTTTDVAQLMTAAGVGEFVGNLSLGALASASFFRGKSAILFISVTTIFGFSTILVSFSRTFLLLMAFSSLACLIGFSSFVIMPIMFTDAFGINGYVEFYAFAVSCSSVPPIISVFIAEWIFTVSGSWGWPIRYIGILSIVASLPIAFQSTLKNTQRDNYEVLP